MSALAAVRFVLEVCLLVAVAVAGASVGWWAAVVAPLVVAAVWGRWIAPKAAHRLDDPARLRVEVLLFIAAGIALVATGRTGFAVALTGASIVVAVAVRSSGGDV